MGLRDTLKFLIGKLLKINDGKKLNSLSGLKPEVNMHGQFTENLSEYAGGVVPLIKQNKYLMRYHRMHM